MAFAMSALGKAVMSDVNQHYLPGSPVVRSRAIAMEYKGIPYKVFKSTTPHVWAWRIIPPHSTSISGEANSLSGAAFAAKRAVKKWILEYETKDNPIR
jgi:hypothetical protein